MAYKRLTIETEYGCGLCHNRKCKKPNVYCKDRLECEIYNRLAELEDKIEQGTLKEEKTCIWEEWQDGDFDSVWCCSNCKEDFCFIEGGVPENNYGYCPHCGAKIIGLKELQE